MPAPDDRDEAARTSGGNGRRIRPLSDFLHDEAAAGLLIVIAAVIAMVWANSPLVRLIRRSLDDRGRDHNW